MSAEPHGPDDTEFDIVDVDVREWVEAARANPAQYRDRQVTEIVLAAIGLTPDLNANLVLKGGTVMALAFKSNRVVLLCHKFQNLPGLFHCLAQHGHRGSVRANWMAMVRLTVAIEFVT